MLLASQKNITITATVLRLVYGFLIKCTKNPVLNPLNDNVIIWLLGVLMFLSRPDYRKTKTRTFLEKTDKSLSINFENVLMQELI